METRTFGGKDDKRFWSDKPLQKGHPDFRERIREKHKKKNNETN